MLLGFDMNKSVLMIMGGAVVVAIIVAMLVQMKMAPKKPVTAQQAPGVEILVASKALRAGDTLKAEDTRWQSVPESVTFTGVVKKDAQADDKQLEVYGKVLRRDVMSGEPVTTQAVVLTTGGGNFLAAALTPGMRAVALPVRAESMVGGFVTPGDYVDVILTYQLNLRGEVEAYASNTVQRYASETVLSNVRVLAVDQNAREGNREAKVARTVTIEVKPEEAQILAIASNMGDLSLALRRVGEEDNGTTPLTTDLNTSRVMQQIYRNMGDSQVNSGTVRVYSGSSVINMPVRIPAPRHEEKEERK